MASGEQGACHEKRLGSTKRTVAVTAHETSENADVDYRQAVVRTPP
jgi:hypothetical protein